DSIARSTRSLAATMPRRRRGCTPRTTTSPACRPIAFGPSKDSWMSFSIWTRCAGGSELRTLRLSPWRVVEAQHQVSTRKLVDSTEEQILLEELIDSVKPPDITSGRLHYLLFTPFRYPPLPHGSRFGGRHERGIWYGSLELRSAFAEVAYYRLLFIEGSS